MYQSKYYIEKASNTLADNLAAFGLAFVLKSIAEDRSEIVIEDAGHAYIIHCLPAIHESWAISATYFTGAPFVITIDNKSQKKLAKGSDVDLNELPEHGLTVIDYETLKQQNAEYYAWIRGLPKEQKRDAVTGKIHGPSRPHSDWDIFRAINPGSLQAHNRVVAEWYRGKDIFPKLLEVLLILTSKLPNDVANAQLRWSEICRRENKGKTSEVTASQLLNPSQGKGTNHSKSQWREPGNLKEFWLLEYLKTVGLFNAGITRLIRGTKDRKTYVLTPKRLEWNTHIQIMKTFREAMIGNDTPVRLDILSILRYTRALLEHFETAREVNFAERYLGKNASDLVSGFETAFYKSLGNSAATMNIASLNLPGWVMNINTKTLGALKDALDEHDIIIRLLNEDYGEEYNLLLSYRDFLSANDLTPFFEFTAAYSGLIIHKLEKRQFVRPFTTTTLEVLFMNSDDARQHYSHILQDEGFKNIAYAIRHSTVIPQARKRTPNPSAVSVRYGLGQQLTRKSAYPSDFLVELAEFLQLYNAENAQLRENKREPMRKNITTADIEAVTSLVDEYGSRLVCNMLVAYGYAREPYEAKNDQQPELGSQQDEFLLDDNNDTEAE